ncbi:MAG: hypothetical protein JKY71_02525 [Alphaproteobacteria bacterium]|nr:hypothetical protein [Alphaproteobacteria bacterium]
MLYSIGNIFTREPRQAEQTDTRQAIQRHDPEFERPSQEKQQDATEEFGEDFAHVSVEALSVFLKNFVREQSAETPQDTNEQPLVEEYTTPQVSEPIPQSTATNSAAAQAASAYQSMAHSHRHEEVLIETTDAAQGPSLDLSAEDVRAINALIDDLEVLKQARVETLQIERAASFLESLKNAVDRAKATL